MPRSSSAVNRDQGPLWLRLFGGRAKELEKGEAVYTVKVWLMF